jgi:hypothetical protein
MQGRPPDTEGNCEYIVHRESQMKKWYQPRINIMKDEDDNMLADLQSVFNRWKNFFSQVLKVYGVHNIRQKDIQTAEPLVPEPGLVEVEVDNVKL